MLDGEFESISYDGSKDIAVGLPVKRRVTAEEGEGNGADRPYVARLVIFALDHFGRHVVRRSDRIAHRSFALLVSP